MDSDGKSRLIRKAEDTLLDHLIKIESTNPAKASEILDGIGSGSASEIVKCSKAAKAFLAAS